MRLTWLLGCLLLGTLTGCGGESSPPLPSGKPPTPGGAPPAVTAESGKGTGSSAGQGGGMSVSIPQGEVILDRYKDKPLCIVATPGFDHPSYRQYVKDGVDIDKLAGEKGLVVIELIDAKMGAVRGGAALDNVSISRLVSEHLPDKSVMTVIIVGEDGKETAKSSGEVNVKDMLQAL